MNISVSRQWLYGVVFPFCLIVLPVFIDMAQGALGQVGRAGPISIGVALRGGLVVLALYLLLRLSDSLLKSFLFALLAVFLISNLVWLLSSDVYSLMHELNQGMRVAFSWLIVGVFLYLDREVRFKPLNLFSLMAWAGFLSALSIILAMALGVGHQTYGEWSYGSKGLFKAQNDTGLMLLITLVAAIVVFIRTRKIMYIAITVTIASAGILLGTRTGVLGPVVIMVAFFLAAILNPRMFSVSPDKRGWKASVLLIVPIVLAMAVAAVIFSHTEKTTFLTKKIGALAEGTPRSKLEAAGAKRLSERDLIHNLFGEGGLAFKKHVAKNLGKGRHATDLGVIAAPGQSSKLSFLVHRVENDVFDVLGFYGIVQFAVLYGGLALVYALALRRAYRSWSLENVAQLLILTLYLGHSTLAGHALFSAQVASVIAPIMFLQIRDLCWRSSRGQAERLPIDVRDKAESFLMPK